MLGIKTSIGNIGNSVVLLSGNKTKHKVVEMLGI